MDTPGVNHIILTVSDLDKAKAFYGDLLGFTVDESYKEYNILSFPCGGLTFWLIKHDSTPAGDRFSEFRLGLDHVAFTAPNEAALRALADKLIAAGVDTKGVETFKPTGNLYMAFRDPDNIQLEYWLEK